MKRDFYFRTLYVGSFTSDELPCSAGRYSYKPVFVPHILRRLWIGKPDMFPPSGDIAMRKALIAGERPICYYYTKDSCVFFRVQGCTEEGILDLCDFESQLWPLPGIIAEQLAPIYFELVEKRPFSYVARVPLTEAPASGRALQLLIWQCDSKDLSLVGISRRWWIAGASGLRPDGDWPLTNELLNSERGACENPHVKFATDGQRVRFGLHLGMTRPGRYWYSSREAPLDPDGRFILDQLVERCFYK